MKDNRKYRYHCKVIDVKNSDFRDETARVHALEQRRMIPPTPPKNEKGERSYEQQGKTDRALDAGPHL